MVGSHFTSNQREEYINLSTIMDSAIVTFLKRIDRSGWTGHVALGWAYLLNMYT